MRYLALLLMVAIIGCGGDGETPTSQPDYEVNSSSAWLTLELYKESDGSLYRAWNMPIFGHFQERLNLPQDTIVVDSLVVVEVPVYVDVPGPTKYIQPKIKVPHGKGLFVCTPALMNPNGAEECVLLPMTYWGHDG